MLGIFRGSIRHVDLEPTAERAARLPNQKMTQAYATPEMRLSVLILYKEVVRAKKSSSRKRKIDFYICS